MKNFFFNYLTVVLNFSHIMNYIEREKSSNKMRKEGTKSKCNFFQEIHNLCTVVHTYMHLTLFNLLFTSNLLRYSITNYSNTLEHFLRSKFVVEQTSLHLIPSFGLLNRFNSFAMPWNECQCTGMRF